jgi:hypothetical protein
VDNKIDSLENLFDEKFVGMRSNGDSQSKTQYITRLKGGNFIHNSIDVEDNSATVVNNIAVVVGKGKFSVTVSGNTCHFTFLIQKFLEDPALLSHGSYWRCMRVHRSIKNLNKPG